MVAQSPAATGATRYVVAGHAAGCFLMSAGVIFVMPFLLSPRAQENDVFMTNLFIGPLIYLAGSLLTIWSLPNYGLRHWLALALAIGNSGLLVGLLSVSLSTPTSGYGALAPLWAADEALLLAISVWVAARHAHWRALGTELLLGAAGVAALWLAYAVFGGRYYAFGETVSSLPPFLDLPMLGITLALALVIFLGVPQVIGAQSHDGA